jgi:hypothetical protein
MTGKGNFSSDEWQQIVDGVLIAGLAVAYADNRGPTRKEMKAFMKELTSGEGDPRGNWLIGAIATDIKAAGFGMSLTLGWRAGMHFDLKGSRSERRARAMVLLGEVSDLLDRSVPSEVVAYKSWLVRMGKRVAEASKEGGFLGIGGRRVSDAEITALVEVCKALKVPLPSLEDV